MITATAATIAATMMLRFMAAVPTLPIYRLGTEHISLESVFVTGTDTGVGKTMISAGIAHKYRNASLNVGIMKPYSAGPESRPSDDARILADAAGIVPTPEINPHHQGVAAPPYGVTPLIPPHHILEIYHRLYDTHDIMVVEGMGGVMVPILRDYFMIDLARDMDLPVIVVADNRIGSINHTLMSLECCRHRGARILGIVLNIISDGYDADMIHDTIQDMVDIPLCGVVPTVSGWENVAEHLRL